MPVVGLEPSCLATLRSDAVELTDDPRAVEVAGDAHARRAARPASTWPPPDLTGVDVVAQPHCHHASVLGWEADQRAAASGPARPSPGSAAAAGWPATSAWSRATTRCPSRSPRPTCCPPSARNPGAVVLADGLSCRVQLDDLADVPAMHLAELLAL